MTTGPKKFKFCKKCQQSKPISDYYVRATGRLEAWCKPCNIRDTNQRKAEKRRLARELRAALPAPAPLVEKQCSKCAAVKPVSEFYRRRDTGNYIAKCRECAAASLAEWRSKPGVREASAIRDREYAARNRERTRARKFAKYGLTVAEYDAMYDAQGGLCLICSRPKSRVGTGDGRSEVLCVDHNHVDGRVRGLLCTACNGGIGLLGDDVERLAKAITYLRERESNASEVRSDE